MCKTSNPAYREPSLDSSYNDLLLELKLPESSFDKFKDWSDVITVARKGIPWDPCMDPILRPILFSFRRDGDHRWPTVLAVIFWRSLLRLHRAKRQWDPMPDELWQNIHLTFQEVIHEFKPQNHVIRIAPRIQHETFHRLYKKYRNQWATAKQFVGGIDLARAFEERNAEERFMRIDLGDTLITEACRLQRCLRAGLINHLDRRLLHHTRLLGKSLSDYASEVGLDYEMAKKRRLRAEAAVGGVSGIKEFFKKNVPSPSAKAPFKKCGDEGNEQQRSQAKNGEYS